VFCIGSTGNAFVQAIPRATGNAFVRAIPRAAVDRVDTTDPEGVDFGWVMQTTFVLTVLVGAPVVAVLSTTVRLPTWTARASFAVRVGALVWLVTAVAVYAYARSET